MRQSQSKPHIHRNNAKSTQQEKSAKVPIPLSILLKLKMEKKKDLLALTRSRKVRQSQHNPSQKRSEVLRDVRDAILSLHCRRFVSQLLPFYKNEQTITNQNLVLNAKAEERERLERAFFLSEKNCWAKREEKPSFFLHFRVFVVGCSLMYEFWRTL